MEIITLKKADTQQFCGERTDRGYNMTTYSKLPFWPQDPQAEDVRIIDIAVHLSRLCRYNGAISNRFEIYSVAQHSVMVARNLPPELQLEGLLHDAAEAYLGDMIKPNKQMHRGRKQIEDRIDRVIRQKFGLPEEMTPEVKYADMRCFLTEHYQDIPRYTDTVDWALPSEEEIERLVFPQEIKPMLPSQARRQFLRMFHKLYNNNGEVE